MKIANRQSLVFFATCAVTAAVWLVAWPETEELIVLGIGPVTPPRIRSPREIQGWVDALGNAASDEERLKAAVRLSGIPVSELAATLEQITLIEDRQLTLAAKVLLIRWAADDGEAAADWAWKRFRSKGVWEHAFREITASWAWHQPAELCAWAKRMAHEQGSGFRDVSLAVAEQSDHPLLDFGMLDRICRNLIRVAPREAFEILQLRGGFSSNDPKLMDSLQTVAAVREALTAFDCLDRMQPNQTQGSEIFARSILSHWKKLDPEDFASSPYAHLIPDWSQASPVPIPDGPRGWVREFSEWNEKHPKGSPDMSDWSVEKREAWTDLESLRQD